MTVGAELRTRLGDDVVLDGVDEIRRVLKDNSWLSPILAENLERRFETEGPTLGVDAVVAPRSLDELISVVSVAATLRVPITPRGSGTSNFGLVAPDQGGIVLDLRGLRSGVVIDGEAATAAAGTMQGAMEAAGRVEGRELCALTTTYATATVGGWIAGGHVGLGSSVNGSVWDRNVLGTRVVTVEEQPQVIVLDANGSIPLLHTFGAVGIVAEVSLRTLPAVDYVEVVGNFPDFERAAAFTHEISTDTTFIHRVATAQEPSLAPCFRMLHDVIDEGSSPVLMITAAHQADGVADLASKHGGVIRTWQPWQLDPSGKASIAAMVYGHRMLWVKRLFPDAGFLHVYLDPDEPMRDVEALKSRFRDQVLFEMKYIRSAWMRKLLGHAPDGTLPAAVITVRTDGDNSVIERVMDECTAVGIPFQNPHTAVIEDTGMFPDVGELVAAKRAYDPFGLLNPGKLRAAEAS